MELKIIRLITKFFSRAEQSAPSLLKEGAREAASVVEMCISAPEELGHGTTEWTTSPGDRFQTLEEYEYEDVLEQIEARGIARIEARRRALYKALEDIHAAGKNCINSQGVSAIIQLASEPLTEYKRELYSTWISSEEQVMHLALAAVKYSEKAHTLARSSYNREEVKNTARAFVAALDFLIKLDTEGLHVGGWSIDDIAAVIYKTCFHYPVRSYMEFGAQISAIAEAALDQVDSMAPHKESGKL
jgi:hypothetical protein